MKLIPYIHEGKVEVRVRSFELFADYPWWFEVATLGISNLMEVQIQGDIKKKIKETILSLIQRKLDEISLQDNHAQIVLRMHKIELLSYE